jgi:hypothetical protein
MSIAWIEVPMARLTLTCADVGAHCKAALEATDSRRSRRPLRGSRRHDHYRMWLCGPSRGGALLDRGDAVTGVVRGEDSARAVAALGAQALRLDLERDDLDALCRAGGAPKHCAGERIFHFAPPPGQGVEDPAWRGCWIFRPSRQSSASCVYQHHRRLRRL